MMDKDIIEILAIELLGVVPVTKILSSRQPKPVAWIGEVGRTSL